MLYQIAVIIELFEAKVTEEWFFSRVRPLMYDQCAFLPD